MIGKVLVTHQTGPEGKEVKRLYIEAGSNIAKEYYLSAVVDRKTKKIVFMASTEGGVEIEEVAANTPEKIISVTIDPATSIQGCHARKLGFALNLTGDKLKKFNKLVFSLYEAFVKTDASQVEINPLVETKEGDISAYIPTNVISITDGQIFLQTNLFYSGIRPAIDAGNSVSRVGGAAQTKAIKKVSGTLRLNLASYRELEAFTQFGSDLDDATKATLERGRRTVEILKQGLHENLRLSQMTIALASLREGFLDQIAVEDIRRYEKELYSFMQSDPVAKEIANTIDSSGAYPDEAQVKDVLTRFTKQFS